MDPSNAPAPPPAKSLGERVAYAKTDKRSSSGPLTITSANPKAQPKSATTPKSNTANGTGKKAANKARKRGKNVTRSKPKTAEELDAEMTDYFNTNSGGNTTTMMDANGNATANGNVQPAAAAGGEDLGMDEISVSSSVDFIT